MARPLLPAKYNHQHKSSLNLQLSLEDIGIELASCVSSGKGHWTGERMMQGFWRGPRLVPQPAPSAMAARGLGLGADNQISG